MTLTRPARTAASACRKTNNNKQKHISRAPTKKCAGESSLKYRGKMATRHRYGASYGNEGRMGMRNGECSCRDV